MQNFIDPTPFLRRRLLDYANRDALPPAAPSPLMPRMGDAVMNAEPRRQLSDFVNPDAPPIITPDSAFERSLRPVRMEAEAQALPVQLQRRQLSDYAGTGEANSVPPRLRPISVDMGQGQEEERFMQRYGNGTLPGDASPSPAPIPERLRPITPTPDDAPQMPERPIVKRGGVRGTLKHIAKGALAGLAAASGGGGAASIGGAITGAITGGVSPQTISDWQHKNVTIPNWQREQRVQAEVTGQHQQKRLREAQIQNIGADNERDKAAMAERERAAAERERVAQERIRQGDERAALAERKADDAARLARIRGTLSAARLPGRKFTPEAKAELETELGVTLPEDFNPTTHDIKQAQDGAYHIVTVDKQTGVASVAPITTPDGKPLVGKQPSQSTPSYVMRGRAQSELLKERGYQSATQLVPNPAFEELVQSAKAQEAQAASASGRSPASDEEIRRTVRAQNPKVREKMRAGDAIKGDVDRRAAEIWEREKGKGKASAAAPSSRVNTKQMSADEGEYQRLYPSLTPAQRKTLEDAFQRDYGRKPKASQ